LTKEEAEKAIAGHQACIDRGSRKAAFHQRSIEWYRRQFPDINPPVFSFGGSNTGMHPANIAERERIELYKQGKLFK
jgi:hypothetical protein